MKKQIKQFSLNKKQFQILVQRKWTGGSVALCFPKSGVPYQLFLYLCEWTIGENISR